MVVATHTLEMKLLQDHVEVDVDLLPLQGLWTAEQYLKLTDQTNHFIEFTAGVLEMLPMPTDKHQAILEYFYDLLRPLMRQMGGKVHFAVLRMQISGDRFREPDLLLLRNAKDPRRQNRYWRGADLVLEVVSPGDPERDLVEKRADYAAAGIPEYWIVNPLDETITVLTLRSAQGPALAGAAYAEHGVFRRGATATSPLLPGFAVAVGAVFDAD